MDKIVRIFLLKLAQKPYFLHIPGAISSFANIDGPVTFLLFDLECLFLFLVTWIYN